MAPSPNHALPPVASNPRWRGLVCVLCGRHHGVDHDGFVCASCGDEGILDVLFDGPAERPRSGTRATTSLWRFASLLPVAPTGEHAAWSVGGTPLHDAPRLARHLGLSGLRLKDDTGLPSASLKDRAAAVAIARARQLGIGHLACASTGNAAASLAVLSARAGMGCTIYVPASAPAAKLAQLLVHGAQVIRVDGSYDQAFELSLREIARHRWYSRNCAHNPLLVEGKKTCALEIAATLTDDFTAGCAALPDAVFVPTGDGCIVASTAKAFLELRDLGWTDRVPRVYGVQAENAAPLAAAWRAAGPDAATWDGPAVMAAVKPVVARTLADSICVGVPRNRIKAWRKVAATGGAFLAVPDEAIVEAIGLLASRAGVFAEPSGAAGLAGLVAARDAGLVASSEAVAVLVTGHGLKDPGSVLDGHSLPKPVPVA